LASFMSYAMERKTFKHLRRSARETLKELQGRKRPTMRRRKDPISAHDAGYPSQCDHGRTDGRFLDPWRHPRAVLAGIPP